MSYFDNFFHRLQEGDSVEDIANEIAEELNRAKEEYNQIYDINSITKDLKDDLMDLCLALDAGPEICGYIQKISNEEIVECAKAAIALFKVGEDLRNTWPDFSLDKYIKDIFNEEK